MPLPATADLLLASAALGARVAALLDPDMPVPGVTTGTLDAALREIALPTRRGGGAMTEQDRTLSARWDGAGKDGAVMPGRGKLTPRPFAADEPACAEAAALLGPATNDVFLNDDAYWRNVPDTVWASPSAATR